MAVLCCWFSFLLRRSLVVLSEIARSSRGALSDYFVTHLQPPFILNYRPDFKSPRTDRRTENRAPQYRLTSSQNHRSFKRRQTDRKSCRTVPLTRSGLSL